MIWHIAWPRDRKCPGEAAEVACLEGALNGPQDNAEEDDEQQGEQHDALPVIAHVTTGKSPNDAFCGGRGEFWFAQGHVDTDAVVGILGVRGLPAAELGALHPKHLLSLEFRR